MYLKVSPIARLFGIMWYHAESDFILTMFKVRTFSVKLYYQLCFFQKYAVYSGQVMLILANDDGVQVSFQILMSGKYSN